MLPRAHVKLVVLPRGRRCDRVSPRTAQPLHTAAISRLARDAAQVVQNVLEAHLLQAPEQGPRVIEHHPRVFALGDQLRHELAHAPVAPAEHLRVIALFVTGAVHHPLQVADDRRGPELRPTRRDERLVHMQGDGERAADAAEIDPAVPEKDRAIARAAELGLESRVCTTDVRQTFDRPAIKCVHEPRLSGLLLICGRCARRC